MGGEVCAEALGELEEGLTVVVVPPVEHRCQYPASLGFQSGDHPLPVPGRRQQSRPAIGRVLEPPDPAPGLHGTEMTADGGGVETEVTGQLGDPDRALRHHPSHHQEAGALAVDPGLGSDMLVEALQHPVTEQTGHRLLKTLQALIGRHVHPTSIMVVFTNQIGTTAYLRYVAQYIALRGRGKEPITGQGFLCPAGAIYGATNLR